MSYWGIEPDQNDFAFDGVGAYIHCIKEGMFKDIEVVKNKKYPEQSMIASLRCLRVIGEQFPKNLRVSFRKKDLALVKTAFYEWVELVDLPAKYSAGIIEEAEKEFELFELFLQPNNEV